MFWKLIWLWTGGTVVIYFIVRSLHVISIFIDNRINLLTIFLEVPLRKVIYFVYFISSLWNFINFIWAHRPLIKLLLSCLAEPWSIQSCVFNMVAGCVFPLVLIIGRFCSKWSFQLILHKFITRHSQVIPNEVHLFLP